MWDVSREKRMTRQYQACRKDNSLPTKEWSLKDQGWACNLCVEKEEKIKSIERELERLKAKVMAGERCKEDAETSKGGMVGSRNREAR